MGVVGGVRPAKFRRGIITFFPPAPLTATMFPLPVLAKFNLGVIVLLVDTTREAMMT